MRVVRYAGCSPSRRAVRLLTTASTMGRVSGGRESIESGWVVDQNVLASGGIGYPVRQQVEHAHIVIGIWWSQCGRCGATARMRPIACPQHAISVGSNERLRERRHVREIR